MILMCLVFFISAAKECFNQELGQETQRQKNEVCYDQVGCFSQEAPWVTVLRPFPPPLPPDKQHIAFFLVTEANRPVTVFINHGFMAGINSNWMVQMAQAYLSRTDANVFLVDWGGGAQNANYLQVAANIRVVGVMAARFLRFLIEKTNLNPNQVHCIGHSLGAHICGYMGKQVPGIGRITALDAAQLGFEGLDPVLRLNLTDALNVDAIHTNGKPTIPTFGLGFITTIGHIDYYFNGGFHQPGCIDAPLNPAEFQSPLDVARLPVKEISELLSCSHSKAIEYFTEAIRRTDCTIWGRRNGPVTGVLNLMTFGLAQQIMERTSWCTLEICSPVGLESFRYPGRGKFQISTYFSPQYCNARNTENMNQQLLQWSRYSQ